MKQGLKINSNPFNKLAKPILVSAHDAGAANHLAALLEAHRPTQTFISVSGPAKNIFNNNFQNAKTIQKTFKTVICGTGWQTNWEHKARKKARADKSFLISLIDHWSNYKTRFSWNRKSIFPDEIWVTDSLAYKMCKKAFPNIKTKQLKNWYLEKTIQKIKESKLKTIKYNILYFTEPIRKTWGNLKEPGEKIAFINFLNLHPEKKYQKILVKVHPSEKINKYKSWSKKRGDLFINKKINLSNAIAQSRAVYGCYSYALFIAKCYGRKVYSAIPQKFRHIKVNSL